ncbi:MAG: hypothetical protein CMA41_01155 [Euryarchaeota archaeon]|nr:hypothetical protein [Euryarchaeota archaeon]
MAILVEAMARELEHLAMEVKALQVGAAYRVMEAMVKAEFVAICSFSDVAFTHLYSDWMPFYP